MKAATGSTVLSSAMGTPASYKYHWMCLGCLCMSICRCADLAAKKEKKKGNRPNNEVNFIHAFDFGKPMKGCGKYIEKAITNWLMFSYLAMEKH